MNAFEFNDLFDKAVAAYHVSDDVNAACTNPYAPGSLEFLLYKKCWIDAVQWHLEDIIRDPQIDPAEALSIKRWIDRLSGRMLLKNIGPNVLKNCQFCFSSGRT